MLFPRWLLVLGVFAAFAAGVTAQRVWIVAPVAGTGVDFTKIQDAVNTAQNGDIVLVRSGIYDSFEIHAKSLVVAADGGVILTAAGLNGLWIADTQAGQPVTVRGMSGIGPIASGPPLTITNCKGPVTIEDGSYSSTGISYFAAATVTSSPAVNLIRCVITGGGIRNVNRGLETTSSGLALHGCVITGASYGGISNPAEGAYLSGGTLTASGCTFRGGNGKPGSLFGTSCLPPQNGADALVLAGGVTWLLDCTFVPGQPGAPASGCPPSNPGKAISGGGTVNLVAGRTSVLSAGSPVRGGQSATLTLTGPTGHDAWLALAPAQNPVLIPGCGGTVLPDLASGLVLFLGAMPASGQLTLQVPVPNAFGLQGAVVYLQMFLTQPGVGCFAGTPTALLLLDSRF